MKEWVFGLRELQAAGDPVTVVTVVGTRGSSPCEAGAKMIVTPNEMQGTIGGGRLEYRCTHIARKLIHTDAKPPIERFPLGASVGQCCGGIVEVLFEPTPNGIPDWLRYLAMLRRRNVSAVLCTYLGDGREKFIVTELGVYRFPTVATDRVLDQARQNLRTYRVAQRYDGWFLELVGGRGFNVAVFGAGHVGSAVVRTLCALECDIRWIDTRRNIFGKTPRNVRAIECERPAAEVDAMPADSCYLVMTHDHDLDFDICARILRRNDAAYCGLIGSQSKRRRFEKKYVQQGLSRMAIDQLVCPIGIDGIRGKKPAEIAISASAQVLRAHEELRRTVHVEGPVERHQSDDAQ